MARSRKPRSPDTPESGEVPTDEPKPTEEAAVPEATSEEVETAAAGELPFDTQHENAPLMLEETAEAEAAVESNAPEESATADGDEAAKETQPEDLPDSESRPAPTPPAPPSAPARSGPGFLPLFLGGVAAAALGFILARYAVPEGWPNPPAAPAVDVSAAVEAQASRLAAIEQQLTELSAKVDAADAEPAPAVDIDALRDQVVAALPAQPAPADAAAMDALEARIAELAGQVQALAAQPAEPPTPTEDQMAAFQAQLDGAVAEARSQIEAAQAEAARIEAEAAQAAERAAATAALEQVAAALDTGADYAEPLAVVVDAGMTVPEVLTAGADGSIATLPTLQSEFPDAARTALDASIRADPSGTTMERAIAFLRTQTGARSLTPREGDDPDAVLSRAEAALRDGDVSVALTELGGLPEAGLVAMADWKAAAERRQAALTALDELRTGLETN